MRFQIKSKGDFEEFYEPTLNQMGFMLRKIDPFAKKFLENLSQNEGKFDSIDIGSAYGSVTLEALKMDQSPSLLTI